MAIQWNYDASSYKENDYSVIPEGDHRVRIADVQERTFKSGNEGFEITLDVSGHNSKLWYYLVINPANPEQTNQRLGTFFNSFGITNTQLGNGQQWIGKSGAVRVKHEEYNGNQNAKVHFFINKSKQDSLPPWKGNTTTAQPQPQVEFTQVNPDDLPFN